MLKAMAKTRHSGLRQGVDFWEDAFKRTDPPWRNRGVSCSRSYIPDKTVSVWTRHRHLLLEHSHLRVFEREQGRPGRVLLPNRAGIRDMGDLIASPSGLASCSLDQRLECSVPIHESRRSQIWDEANSWSEPSHAGGCSDSVMARQRFTGQKPWEYPFHLGAPSSAGRKPYQRKRLGSGRSFLRSQARYWVITDSGSFPDSTSTGAAFPRSSP